LSQISPAEVTVPGHPRSGQEPVSRGKGRHSPASRQSLTGWLFVLPFAIVVLIFLVLPLGYAFWLSMYSESLALGSHFSGLKNYKQTFTDPVFLQGVKTVLLFGVFQIPLMLGVALAGALAVDALGSKLSRAYRLIAFMPYAVPTVIGALMWGFLYSKTFGPFARLGNVFGSGPINFFSASFLLFSLGNIVTWSWTGYNMIVMYSALQGVPREMYEAAIVDGASHLQIALRIKVPAISRAILLATIFTVIGTMQLFTEPQILTTFAPNISNGYTPNLYAYNLAFRFSEFHYSAAISFTLGVAVFLVSYVFVFSSRRRESGA
jgi:multiple sugar transport system permease protein